LVVVVVLFRSALGAHAVSRAGAGAPSSTADQTTMHTLFP